MRVSSFVPRARPRPSWSGRLHVAVALACAAGAAACDLPTELPRWSTSWEVVAVDKEITTASLLPEGVRLDPGGFAIDSFAVTSTVRLGDVCELCTCFDGPIPALEVTPQEWALRLPAGLVEAELLTGRAELVITNGIGFDLLDDGRGGRGRLTVTLDDPDTGETLDRRTLEGSWPAGDSVRLDFPLADLRLHDDLVARVTGSIPGSGGCDVPLAEASGFTVRVELRDVVARSVAVALSDAALGLEPRAFTLPTPVARRLRPGEARIALDVRLRSGVPTSAEVDLSVAPDPGALFTAAASLHTPLVLPAAADGSAADAHGLYLLGLEGVPATDRLHFAARTRLTGPRVIRLTGAESLRYRLVVRAEVPSR